mgnify:CR=1 FL=1
MSADSPADECDFPDACPACGFAKIGIDPAEWWDRTPRGRPQCPDCGAIPEAFELGGKGGDN